MKRVLLSAPCVMCEQVEAAVDAVLSGTPSDAVTLWAQARVPVIRIWRCVLCLGQRLAEQLVELVLEPVYNKRCWPLAVLFAWEEVGNFSALWLVYVHVDHAVTANI